MSPPTIKSGSTVVRVHLRLSHRPASLEPTEPWFLFPGPGGACSGQKRKPSRAQGESTSCHGNRWTPQQLLACRLWRRASRRRNTELRRPWRRHRLEFVIWRATWPVKRRYAQLREVSRLEGLRETEEGWGTAALSCAVCPGLGSAVGRSREDLEESHGDVTLPTS